jgi:hypothetical protein
MKGNRFSPRRWYSLKSRRKKRKSEESPPRGGGLDETAHRAVWENTGDVER